MPTKSNNDTAQVIRRNVYDYQDESGELIYQIVRDDLAGGGKKIWQRRPDGKGDWIPNLQGVTPIPRLLPGVLRVIERGGIIFIVEGEKKGDDLNAALSALKLNAIATCNNGGAGHWGAEQSKWLAGAKVCLLPDNDEQGRSHVEIAARSLMDRATSIKRLELPDLPDKGDIADWLSAGHTIAELQALYHAAVEYTPPAETPRPEPTRPVRRLITRSDRPRLTAWAQAALEGETNDLAGLNDGRFHALTGAANRLGTIAAHGLLSESECLANLMYAMERNQYTQKKGKSHKAVKDEVEFYFRSGLPHPCDLPEAEELPALERRSTAAADDFVAYIPTKTGVVWNKGVPVAVRGLMNAYQGTGPLLELVTEGKTADLIADDQFITVECLVFVSQQLKRGMTEGVIRTMLRKAADPHGVQFLRKVALYNTDHREDSKTDQEIFNSADFRRNPCGCPGRDPEHYQLLPAENVLSNLANFVNAPLIKQAFPMNSDLIAPIRAEFIAALDRPDTDNLFRELSARYGEFIELQPGFAEAMQEVKHEHRLIMYRLRNPMAAPIPGAMTYKNTSEYMTACAYSLVASKGGRTQYGRKFLSAVIGCKDRYLKTVLDRANVEMEKDQYAFREITSLSELKSINQGYDKQHKGFPRFLRSSGEEKWVKFNSAKAFKFVQAALATGAKVEVVYHQANRQVIRRLSLLLIRFLQALLALLGNMLRAVIEPEQQELFPEPEPTADPEPKAEPAKKTVKPEGKLIPKITWEERNLRKMANAFTEWQIDPDQAVNKVTGSRAEPTAQLAFDALLGHTVTPAAEEQAYRPAPRVVDFRDVKQHWNADTRTWDSPDYVYIGRGNINYNLRESKWANPYKIGEHGSRADAIALYDIDVNSDPLLLSEIRELRNRTLVCWCKSQDDPDAACHGDVLIGLADLPDEELQKLIDQQIRAHYDGDGFLSWLVDDMGGTLESIERVTAPYPMQKVA